MFKLPILVTTLFSLAPLAATAHEFWIAPTAFQVEPGAPLVANIRVGQELEGPAYSFNANNFRRFDLIHDGQVTPVAGTIGDRPALNMDWTAPGLVTVVHVTTDANLRYSEWEKFVAFVEHKDLGDTIAQHDARGLPRDRFHERYSRYAKSLIAVGDGAGADTALGLETEITALANPFTDDLSAGFPVALTYQGAPRIDQQIEVFERAPSGEVATTLIRTDDAGRALVPVRAGYEYMLDAVLMRPIEAADPATDQSWESLWANLTFAVPAP